FWAECCDPARALAPIVELAAEQCASAAHILKLNVDDSPAVMERYGIQAIPTLILFEDGVEKERVDFQPHDEVGFFTSMRELLGRLRTVTRRSKADVDSKTLGSGRLLKSSVCRLLKKISEGRRAKNRRAEAYIASTL